jgi:hypothetical protein
MQGDILNEKTEKRNVEHLIQSILSYYICEFTFLLVVHVIIFIEEKKR